MDITPALAPRPAGSGQPGRSLHRFANPGRFLRISGAVLPWLAVAGFGYIFVFAAIVLTRTRSAVMERRIRGLLSARAERQT